MIRLGALGDVVRTLPAASRLRAAYPGAQLSWLVEPAAAGALAEQSWIDEVLVFPRDRVQTAIARLDLAGLRREVARFGRALRRRRFDLVLDFHGLLRSGLLARLTGAALRVGYARPVGRELAYLFASHRARLAPGRRSRFARNAALVDYLGVPADLPALPFEVRPQARARMAARLGSGPAPVALHPGSSPATPHKRYTAEGYAELARALAAQGWPSVVTWGSGAAERAVAEAIAAASHGAARVAPETRALGDLAALFSHCRLVVGGDTGPLHLAALVGTPVVQLLGPTDPVENQLWPGTPSRTLRVPVACAPCRRGCRAAPCVRSISPATVAAAARELLAAVQAGRPEWAAAAGASA